MGLEVLVRLKVEAEGFYFVGEDGDPLSFTRGAVVIQVTPTASVPEVEAGAETSTLITATTVSIPAAEVQEQLEVWWPRLLTEEREGRGLKLEPPPEEGVGASLRLVKLGPATQWLLHAEPEVAEFFGAAESELRRSVTRLVGILRWLFNLQGPVRLLDRPPVAWSLDALEWVSFFHVEPFPMQFGEFELGLTERGRDLVQETLESDHEGEPLARELLLDAAALEGENPQAALVLAITAAEVGVRSFASSVGREDAAWLLSRPQAPPLDDLLKNYLPFLTEVRTGRRSVVPTELRKIIKRGVESRNKVVHLGTRAPEEKELAELLAAVNDLLYILDWLRGEKWAFSNVSEKWKAGYQIDDELG